MSYALVPENREAPDWEANDRAYWEAVKCLRRQCPEAMAAMRFTDKTGRRFELGWATNSWQRADAECAARLAASLDTVLRTARCPLFPDLGRRDAQVMWDKMRRLQRFLADCGGFRIG